MTSNLLKDSERHTVGETLCKLVKRLGEPVGQVTQANEADVDAAITAAQQGFTSWSAMPAEERAACVRRVGDLLEENAHELFALTTREAGKSLLDAISEIREAVDFSQFYANEAVRYKDSGEARGVICCISPWNFPLAIFAGQRCTWLPLKRL